MTDGQIEIQNGIMVLIRHMLSKYTLYECFGEFYYPFSIVFSIFYVTLHIVIILLPREAAAEAPEMRSVHFVKSMGLTVDIINKGNVIRCNTYQYTNWHELGVYPHL